jgi:hypothetical protein
MKIQGEFSEWENFGVEWGRGVICLADKEFSSSLLARFSRTVAAHTANLLICVVQNNEPNPRLDVLYVSDL